ncbi:hypothetical protein DYB28_001585 [Aphanomyces astaci]|uniref:DDE-1 domain-containing protein n=2 Tax=Aphanomyces astaci TaxID=112090 RepID=A0A3L6UWZ0_APHAT|nr:hypothetical protein DYB26_012862 [Aphanomyces astaci]RLO01070.1 hypothetical protein DYB28_001585 [Aphanomyces astaci]
MNVSRGWYQKFCTRNPRISERLAQRLSKSSNKVDKEGIITYFNSLLKAYVGFHCTAREVYNVDETSFKTKTQSKRVVATRGSRSVWIEENAEAYHLTIVMTAAADGTLVPPAFILPGVTCETSVLDECPVDGALVTTAPKAFMNSTIFNTWLIAFGEWKLEARGGHPAVMVLDSCSSHHCVESEWICETYGILLVFLPPNATHLLQPLDVAIFHSYKRDIKNGVTTYLRAFNAVSLPRGKAISIAGEAFNNLRSQWVSYLWNVAAVVADDAQRLALQTSNSVDKDFGAAMWIRTQVAACEDVLTVPARHTGKERKRVSTDDEWFSMAGLHAAASIPNKRKKASIANRRKKFV